jgi:hypothetical protein
MLMKFGRSLFSFDRDIAMTLERYFRFSAYLMLTTSFVMLVATGQLDSVSVVLFAGALLAGWWIDNEKVSWRIPKRVASWLIVAYLPFVLVDWRLLGSSPVVVLIHFTLFACSLKLLHPKTDRDWLWLSVMAFFEMLLAAGMTIDVLFFLLLIVFLFAAISALTSFEIRRASRIASVYPEEIEIWKETKTVRQHLGRPRWRNLGWFSASVLLLILLMAVPLFLAMPRLSRGFGGAGLMGGATLSGFSENVRLGEVAQVKLNSQAVMRVRVETPAGSTQAALRWRGVTLDYYDGAGWRNSGTRVRTPVPKVDDVFLLGRAENSRKLTKQEILLYPIDVSTIFAAPSPRRLEGLTRLTRDDSDGLWTIPHPGSHLSYTVWSEVSVSGDDLLRQDDTREYPAIIRKLYLQLPENLSPRIADLAKRVAGDAQSPLEVARRLEGHLRTSYSYSLDLRRTNDGDPLDDFLFNVRAGHCEYFATALAIMLRMRGIPARLVSGFQTGEYSEITNSYLVRQSDAHSWVEMYFPQHGWVQFDGTPAAGLNVYEPGFLATLRHYMEAAEFLWLEKVIGFDAEDQFTLAFQTQRLMASWQNSTSSEMTRWRDWFNDQLRALRAGRITDQIGGNSETPESWTDILLNIVRHPLSLTIFCLIGLAGAGWFWHRKTHSWQHRAQRDSSGSAVIFYEELLRTLEKAGHKRLLQQTPLEFARSLMNPAVSEITQIYQEVRFGGRTLTKDEIERLSYLLRELRQRDSLILPQSTQSKAGNG